MQMSPARRKVSAVRAAMLQTHPLLGGLGLYLTPTETTRVQTISSDGDKLYYNPEWVMNSEPEIIRMGIGMRVMACALKHHLRREGRTDEYWQVASRLVTLPMARAAGLGDAMGGIENRAVERVYLDVMREAEQRAKEQGENTQYVIMQQSQDPGESGEGQGDGEGQDGQDGQSSGQSVTVVSQAPPSQQGGGGGRPQKQNPSEAAREAAGPEPQKKPSETQQDFRQRSQNWHDKYNKAFQDIQKQNEEIDRREQHRQEQKWVESNPDLGDVEDGDEEGEATAAHVWDGRIQQAVAREKSEGRGSSPILQLIESIRHQTLDWRALLREFMTSRARTDYSWRKPNERYLDHNVYLPALYTEAMPPIVFAIDTSGSMNDEEIAAAWVEVREAVEATQPERVTVIQCTDKVTSVEQFGCYDMPEKITIKNRGGTDFEPVFNRVEQLQIDPACLVYLTDLECSSFGRKPNYPVVWAATKCGGRTYKDSGRGEPPFGEVVMVEVE